MSVATIIEHTFSRGSFSLSNINGCISAQKGFRAYSINMGNNANVPGFLNCILLILRRSMYSPGRCDGQSSFDPAKMYGLWKLCLPGARQNGYDVHLPLGRERE